jgi:hypothetical protein
MCLHKVGAAPWTHHTTLLFLQCRRLQEQHANAQLVECQLRNQVCQLQAENEELRAELAELGEAAPPAPAPTDAAEVRMHCLKC